MACEMRVRRVVKRVSAIGSVALAGEYGEAACGEGLLQGRGKRVVAAAVTRGRASFSGGGWRGLFRTHAEPSSATLTPLKNAV